VITTFVSSNSPGVTLSGTDVMVAAGTQAGVYVLNYQICEVLNPSNCDATTVKVIVNAAPIDAVNDIGTPVNGANGGTAFTNVLINDTLNGVAVLPGQISLTFVMQHEYWYYFIRIECRGCSGNTCRNLHFDLPNL